MMALLCMTVDQASMQIQICVRSNWQWQVKQVLGPFDFHTTKGVRALKWLSNRKHLLTYGFGNGELGLVEFHSVYTTSMKSFNHKN